jgi:hypothetical protein
VLRSHRWNQADGVQIEPWDCHDGENQKWSLEPAAGAPAPLTRERARATFRGIPPGAE